MPRNRPPEESRLPTIEESTVTRLGSAGIPSPLVGSRSLIEDKDRVIVSVELARLEPLISAGTPIPSFEAGGPREKIFFSPEEASCGIVTCGGLCPGLNDVIRSIVLTLNHSYGARRILGFRYGYSGLSSQAHREPVFLDPENVDRIHEQGGTILGTSRGPQDLGEMIETLVRWKVRILFAIGGDGTLRGASAIAREILARNLKIAVIGVPKTIDNDLVWCQRSFGFITAVEEARTAVSAAHSEAKAAWNGIGLVKLMGRNSGFIAASASLASGDVNFCLVPEVPFAMEGSRGFLAALENRLQDRRHAVVVAAEGAGQDLVADAEGAGTDASGNVRLKDIGSFLRAGIQDYFGARNIPVNMKFIDPSYTIRSQPANAMDSGFCLILGQHAVHAGMAGYTDMMIGFWNQNMVHVPLGLVAGRRKHLDPEGEMWQRVLGATGQPASMC